MHYFCCCCCYCSLFSFLVAFFPQCKLQPMLNMNSCYNFGLHIDSNEMNLYMRNYRANARINCCALYIQSLLYVKFTYFFWPDSYVFAFAWHFFFLSSSPRQQIHWIKLSVFVLLLFIGFPFNGDPFILCYFCHVPDVAVPLLFLASPNPNEYF